MIISLSLYIISIAVMILRFELWELDILAPPFLVIVIDAVLCVDNRVPVVHLDAIPCKCIKGLVNSFLRCSGVPGGNGSILDVSQWALFTRVACLKSLIVGVDNPACGSHFTHVKHHVSSRPHGGDRLHPCARSLSKLIAWIGADGPHTHVVHALWEEPHLGHGADVVPGCVGHGCLIHGVPVAKVPFCVKRCDNFWFRGAGSSLPIAGTGECHKC